MKLKIQTKNRTYYIFNDIVDIIKEYVKIYSLDPLDVILRYVNAYFEEINGNKYLTIVSTNESKEKIK